MKQTLSAWLACLFLGKPIETPTQHFETSDVPEKIEVDPIQSRFNPKTDMFVSSAAKKPEWVPFDRFIEMPESCNSVAVVKTR